MTDAPRPSSALAPTFAIVAAALLCAVGLAPSVAEAQGSIQVRAGTTRGTPVSGTIAARGQAGSHTCTLTSGGCVITGVGPGSYTVTLTVPGRPAARRSVTVARARVNVSFVVQVARTVRRAPPRRALSRPGAASTPRSTAPTGPVPAARRTPALTKSLSSGDRLVVQGTATFTRGTPAVGVVEVRRGTAVVGTARITSGRFTIYDLPAGEYTIVLRETGGGSATRRVTVGRTPITVTLVVSP